MHKKNILFIMPLIRQGGIGSSLASIFKYIDLDKYNVNIFPIVNMGKDSLNDLTYKSHVVRYHKIISAYYCVLSDIKGYKRANVFIVKFLSKILNLFHVDFVRHISEASVKKLINEYSPQTVVSFMEGYATIFTSYFENVKKIAWIHCDFSHHIPVCQSEQKLYEKFDNIVAVSNYTSKIFMDMYPSLADKVSYIYNPLDVERVRKLSNEHIDDNRFRHDRFCIISVGRIAPVKRFDYIPKIASMLKKNKLKFYWYIIGPCYDTIEITKIQKYIDKHDVGDCVIWLGGKRNPYPYFNNADLYVSTSKSEACPMVFNEARILNLPIVSTDFPSASEFIKDGVDGLISPIENISNSISKMIADKDFYNLIVVEGKKYHFDDKAIVNELERIL